ncbi:hypothetical protein GQ602_002863 [Ophiocordyceps camponoti-floridani]|uniref:Uncharacterized protein n=1 Tax=Ophiocordyceps camponoti-floridani TaxID=2030778 RepID=A0A8H4QB70_9HYPO|nr:hypothetical protein GQ602_002863 [Ophiocordyceps camponoti-floridani]
MHHAVLTLALLGAATSVSAQARPFLLPQASQCFFSGWNSEKCLGTEKFCESKQVTRFISKDICLNSRGPAPGQQQKQQKQKQQGQPNKKKQFYVGGNNVGCLGDIKAESCVGTKAFCEGEQGRREFGSTAWCLALREPDPRVRKPFSG